MVAERAFAVHKWAARLAIEVAGIPFSKMISSAPHDLSCKRPSRMKKNRG